MKERLVAFLSDVNFLLGYNAWVRDSLPHPCNSCRHMLQTEDKRHAAMIWFTLPIMMDANVRPWPLPRAAAEVRQMGLLHRDRSLNCIYQPIYYCTGYIRFARGCRCHKAGPSASSSIDTIAKDVFTSATTLQ